MKDVVTTETHVRKYDAVLDSKELERLIADAVCVKIGARAPTSANGPGVTFDVRFEDETAGSPAYKTGTKAIVTITEDLKFVLPGFVIKREGER